MTERTKQMTRKFWRLHAYENYLPRAHRIFLVKSEILSVFEYALPLFENRLQMGNRDSETDKVQDDIQRLIDQCRTWASGIGSKRTKGLVKSMTNILDIKDILESRSASLNQRLLRLPTNHPIKTLHNKQKLIPPDIRDKMLTFKSFTNPIFSTFQKESQRTKTNLKTFIRSRQRKLIMASSILCAYTANLSDKANLSKIDNVYRIKNKKIQDKAILWRQNQTCHIDNDPPPKADPEEPKQTFSCNICKFCYTKINRAHLNECPGLHYSPEISRAQ
jgi:hypothetical protein